jgi:hypothetical protein
VEEMRKDEEMLGSWSKYDMLAGEGVTVAKKRKRKWSRCRR